MSDLFTIANLGSLLMLILLQAVLGFDNLLYISLASKKVAEHQRKKVRLWGIGLAIFLRVGLLFVLVKLITLFQGEFFGINYGEVVKSSFNGHSLIVLFGGGFIIYTAMKEIWHMISHESLELDKSDNKKKTNLSLVTEQNG